jgi:hypothetical protein
LHCARSSRPTTKSPEIMFVCPLMSSRDLFAHAASLGNGNKV